MTVVEPDAVAMAEAEELPPLGEIQNAIEDALELPDDGEAMPPILSRTVRDALLAIKREEAAINDLEVLKDGIVQRYNERISSRKKSIAYARDTLLAVCKRWGKVSYPDVGGAHLRNIGAKVKVADRVAFEDAFLASYLHVRDKAYVEVFDHSKALDVVLELHSAKIVGDKLVSVDGEIVEIAGVEVAPAEQGLTVRGA